MSKYEISKLEALRWTMKTWARVYFKGENKYEAGVKLGMPEWFPFSCGCCAYISQGPTEGMSAFDCVDEDQPCPMLEVCGEGLEPESGVPCEQSGSPYQFYMSFSSSYVAQTIFLGARRLYLQELKRVRNLE